MFSVWIELQTFYAVVLKCTINGLAYNSKAKWLFKSENCGSYNMSEVYKKSTKMYVLKSYDIGKKYNYASNLIRRIAKWLNAKSFQKQLLLWKCWTGSVANGPNKNITHCTVVEDATKMSSDLRLFLSNVNVSVGQTMEMNKVCPIDTTLIIIIIMCQSL